MKRVSGLLLLEVDYLSEEDGRKRRGETNTPCRTRAMSYPPLMLVLNR